MNPEIKKPNNMQTEPLLPLCLAYENAQNEMFAAVNRITQKYGIPPFLMKTILSGILCQVEKGADMEVRNARNSYTKQLEEYQKEKVGGAENADHETIDA